MPDASRALVRTPDEFARLVTEFRERFRQDASFAEVMQSLCGSRERVLTFTSTRGVGISTFADLVGLPASTVRHYQRLGLITPFEVNGKFRFWIHNLIQVESIRQWRDLGLSLEEIQAQRAQERLGGQSATFNARSTSGVSVLVTGKAVTVTPLGGAAHALPLNSLNPRAVWSPASADWIQFRAREVPRDTQHAEQDGVLDVERLRDEVRAARVRLEERLRALEGRLERARALEAALEATTRRSSAS